MCVCVIRLLSTGSVSTSRAWCGVLEVAVLVRTRRVGSTYRATVTLVPPNGIDSSKSRDTCRLMLATAGGGRYQK